MANNGDFIPQARGSYREWLINFKTVVASKGVEWGLTASDILVVTDPIDAIIASMDATIAAESALAAARQDEKTVVHEYNKMFRDLIGGWKKKVGFTAEHAQQLRVVSSRPDLDEDNYKPEFKVRIVGGEIRLDWKKKGADAVYVYARLRGVATWTRIGMDTSSPYIDGRPLAQANVPETREYMLRGVVDDEEIGLDSDVLSITWAGQ
jgi:hypothetical protein